LFPRFFGITNTFKPFFSDPPELELELELELVLEPAAAVEPDPLLAAEELLEDPPHAAMLATAAVNATATTNDRPARRPAEPRLPTSCIRRLLCSSLQDTDLQLVSPGWRAGWSTPSVRRRRRSSAQSIVRGNGRSIGQ
jgi:hypothetical protein